MKITRLDKLIQFSEKHANARGAVDSWIFEVGMAVWKTPHDIKQRFRSADFLSGNQVIFNIKGNHFRLVAEVNYLHKQVAIEWVGTHAEYDKQNFR